MRPVLLGSNPASPASSLSPVVHGAALPGLTITLHRHPAGADAALATVVVGSSGLFDVTVDVSADQTTTLYSRSEDDDGVVSEMSEALTYVHDGTPPETPVLLTTDPVSPGGTAHPVVVGTSEPGATVELFADAACTGIPAGTGEADETGAFAVRIDQMLVGDASHSLRALARDAAGNVSSCSSMLPYYASIPAATFQGADSYLPGSTARIAAAFVNADASPDLVAAGSNSGLLLGDGDGTFTTEPLTLPRPVLHVGDLDRDGLADIVSRDVDDSVVTVRKGLGNATFGTAMTLTTPGSFGVTSVADLNSDEWPDVVVSHFGGLGVTALLLGSGGLQAASLHTTALTGDVVGFSIQDLDGDGVLDLVAGALQGTEIRVLIGNGDGTFTPGAPIEATASIYALGTADLDGDGDIDIAAVSLTDSFLVVALGNGDGTFEPGAPIPLESSADVLVTDFNVDGRPDLAACSNVDQSVKILLGRGDGTFLDPEDHPLGNACSSITAGDFNDDTLPDVAAASFGGARVFLSAP